MDFYQSIRALDHQPVGESLCAIPTGRAYRNGSSLYADKIHVFPYGESLGVLQSVPMYGVRPPALYMGTAGLINIGNICKLKPSYAVLFDVNPLQTIFWNVVLSADKQNESYEGFRNTLDYSEIIAFNVIKQKWRNVQFSAPESMTSALHNGNPESLSRKTFPRCSQTFSTYLDEIRFTSDDYAYFHHMAVQGRIGTLTLDMFDHAGWRQLSASLCAMRAMDARLPQAVDNMYVSSVFRFVKADTDWTGRKLKEISSSGIFEVLDPEKGVVMDWEGVYSIPEFKTCRMKGDTEWPSQKLPTQKESAPALGAGRLALHFT